MGEKGNKGELGEWVRVAWTSNVMGIEIMETQVYISVFMYPYISLSKCRSIVTFSFLFLAATSHYFSCSYLCVKLSALGITEVFVICKNPNSFMKLSLYCWAVAFCL